MDLALQKPAETFVGAAMPYSRILEGLQELNPGIQADVPENRPSDWTYYMDTAAKHIDKVTGLYFYGRFLCAIDRGPMVPELDVWEYVEGVREIDMSEIDSPRYADISRVIYAKFEKGHPYYEAAYARAERKDDNYKLLDSGEVIRYQALVEGMIPDRVIRRGWRETFDRLTRCKVPGIDKIALEGKFKVTL